MNKNREERNMTVEIQNQNLINHVLAEIRESKRRI